MQSAALGLTQEMHSATSVAPGRNLDTSIPEDTYQLQHIHHSDCVQVTIAIFRQPRKITTAVMRTHQWRSYTHCLSGTP